jgi:hypothetical protein
MATPARSQPTVTRTRVLVGVILVATALGAWRTVALQAPVADASTITVGDVSYRVTHAEQVTGLTAEDLSGMAHGIQSLVTAERTLVTVSIVVSAGDSPASYDPSELEVVADGSDTPIPAAGSTISAGPLDAHARLEGAVSFVVPRDGSRLELRSHGQSHSVPLLQVDVPAPGDLNHPHSSADNAPVTVVPAPATR